MFMFKHHAAETKGSGDGSIAPRILSLGVWNRWFVIVPLRLKNGE